MLVTGRHGPHLLGIDASSNPMKVGDDWPSVNEENLGVVFKWQQYQCPKIIQKVAPVIQKIPFGPKPLGTIPYQ